MAHFACCFVASGVLSFCMRCLRVSGGVKLQRAERVLLNLSLLHRASCDCDRVFVFNMMEVNECVFVFNIVLFPSLASLCVIHNANIKRV